MEIIIAIAILIGVSILIMVLMTMVYSILCNIMPLVALVMIISGLFIGLQNAIKNLISVFKEVYIKK